MARNKRTATAKLTLAAALLLLAAPAPARASGGLHALTLEQAVGQATFVLVVERVKPEAEQVEIAFPYEKGGKKMVEKIKTTYLTFKVVKRLKLADSARNTSYHDRSYLHPDKELTVTPEKVGLPGQIVKVINAHDPINHHVRLRYLKDGTHKIPIYPVLKVEVGHEELIKAKRFILLADYNLRYEALAGAGGFGLVSIKQLKKVKKLLKPTRSQ